MGISFGIVGVFLFFGFICFVVVLFSLLTRSWGRGRRGSGFGPSEDSATEAVTGSSSVNNMIVMDHLLNAGQQPAPSSSPDPDPNQPLEENRRGEAPDSSPSSSYSYDCSRDSHSADSGGSFGSSGASDSGSFSSPDTSSSSCGSSDSGSSSSSTSGCD